MPLNASYDTEEEIPEAHRELFTERDGKWELTGITGMKTQADVDRLNASLVKERNDHKETKVTLKTFDGVDLEQFEKDQNELTELRAKVEAGMGGDFDQEKFDEAVDKLANARVATQLAPVQRDLTKANESIETLTGENDNFKTNEVNRTISDAVRTAATGIKVIDTAMDDILMLGERVFEVHEDGSVLTRDGVGATPGIAPDVWLSEMQERRPHWWPASTGGGANGSGGAGGFAENPWSNDHWNMTKQGQAVREDSGKADRMAKAAGTTVGGLRPQPKPPTQAQLQQQVPIPRTPV